MLPGVTTQPITDAKVHRPHTVEEWRRFGLDYAMDKAIDVGGVLVSLFVAWLFIRFIARRVEKWGDDGREQLHSAREQRARTAAKLVRNVGRAVLSIVGVLVVLKQLDFDTGALLASAGVVG